MHFNKYKCRLQHIASNNQLCKYRKKEKLAWQILNDFEFQGINIRLDCWKIPKEIPGNIKSPECSDTKM